MHPLPQRRPPRHAHVLVADDDAQLGPLLGAILRRAGYTPLVVADGLAALEALGGAQRFGCALLDVEMPGLDGASLAWVLASRLPDLPVVMMSGLAPEAVRARLGGLAVAGVLAKPFRPQEVLECLARAMPWLAQRRSVGA